MKSTSPCLHFALLCVLACTPAARGWVSPDTNPQRAHRLPPTVDKLPESSSRYALVVGIAQYDAESNVSPLVGPDKDAEELGKALHDYAGFPEQNIVTLASDRPEQQQPTYSNIVKALLRLRSMVPQEGLLLIAFSGHGKVLQGETYLLPRDVQLYGDDSSSLAHTSLSLSTIKDLLAPKAIQQVIILLDSCRDVVEQSKGVGANPLKAETVAALNLDELNKDIKAFAVVYSTQVGDMSYVDSVNRQSYFSAAVVRGLSGEAANADGEVTLHGLIRYLENTVPPLVKNAKGKAQIPWAYVEGYKADDLVLAKAGRKDAAANPELLSGAAMLITPDGREVYVASAEAGGVLVFNAAGGATRLIDLSPAQPGEMVLAARRGQLYVVDYAADAVLVVDVTTRQVVGRVVTGRTPRALAITPDEGTLYIANEQPAPQGTIGVVDLATRKTTALISGVNCPESLAMAPDGKRLYVATQCGGGQDPVFVVDTQTNKVVKAFPGFAVGTKLVVTRDGAKVYVATEGYEGLDGQGRPARYPHRLSVIDAWAGRTRTLRPSPRSPPLKVEFFATTPDGRYVLGTGDSKLLIIDAATDEVVEEKPLGTRPTGLAVGRTPSGAAPACYVWLPEERRLFIIGLSGILGPHI